jgi:anti-sigma factor (TIGR02949 family)
MNCPDVQRFISAFVDGELVDEERGAFEEHLAVCARCRRIAGFESAFRQRLRDNVERVAAPPHLRARLRQQLDASDRRRRWVWGLRLVPAAAAVAALVLWIDARQRRLSAEELSAFAEATVRSHQQALPLDVHSAGEGPIRRFFADKVPFAVRPPRFRRAAAQLVGARLSHLQRHDAAYLSYVVDGERVSVFVLDPRALPDAAAHAVGPGAPSVSWHDARGYRVGIFRAGGAGYAVAGDVDPSRLVRLISAP